MKQDRSLIIRIILIALIPIFIVCGLIGLIISLAKENINQTDNTETSTINESDQAQYTDEDILILEIEGKPGIQLTAEVAQSFNKKAYGLMKYDSLDEDNAMLFVFAQEQSLAFWMKDTSFSLDIAYLDANKKILNIHEKAIPENTEIKYKSEGLAMYVVETNGGWFSAHGVIAGDMFKFSPANSIN